MIINFLKSSFLNFFSFQLLRGDLKTALKEPNSIVLTEVKAIKIFGEIGPVGKTVVFKKNGSSGWVQYQIIGVLKTYLNFHIFNLMPSDHFQLWIYCFLIKPFEINETANQ
jgi:hypothetical protein